MYPHVLLVSLLFLVATSGLARVVERLPVDSTTALLPRADSPACTEITPHPTGAHCRVHGTSSYGCTHCFRYAPALVASFQDCADLNYKHHGSRFSYNNITNSCQLYHPYPDGRLAMIRPDPLSPTVFSDSRCYRCSNGCPSIQNTYQEIDDGEGLNLLYNGGFETSKTLGHFGPWERFYPPARGIQAPSIIRPGYKSPQAFRSLADVYTIFQRTRPCPGQLYLARYNYKFTPSNAGLGTSLSAYFLASNRYLPARSTAKDASWQTAEYSLQMGKNTYDLANYMEFELFGKVDIDNVELYPLKAPVPIGGNIIPNGDFESGHLAPWSSHVENDSFPKSNHPPIFKVQSPGINSTYALSLTLPAAKNGSTSGTGVLRQVIHIKPNTRYAFSYDYTLSPKHDYFQIFSNFYTYSGSTPHKSELIAHDSWAYTGRKSREHYSRVFLSAGPTMKIEIHLTSFGVTDYTIVNSIDNISLQEVK